MAHAPTQIGLDRRPSGLWDGPGHAWLVAAGFWPALAAAAARSIDLLALAGGMLLLGRRLAGVWQPPAGAAALVVVCVVGGLLVTGGDFARRVSGAGMAILARAGLACAVAALAIPFPVRTAGGVAMAMVALAGAAAVIAHPWTARGRPAGRRPPHPLVVPPPPPPAPAATAPAGVEPAPPGQMLQRFERFTRSDGVECVRGRLFLAVPAGIRTAAGHVGFCPPFARTPTVDVSTDYDGIEAVVSAAEVLPWGVRIDCRLDEPADDPFEIPIDFTAELPPSVPPPV